jgi:AraC-like DNA-binding protein
MAYMDIPYELDEELPAPPCRFKSIWKVQANNSYHVAKPSGFAIPGIFITYEGKGSIVLAGVRHDLDMGTFLIAPPDIPASYRCVDDDWKFYYAEFDTLGMALQLELPVGEPASTAKTPEAIRLSEQLIDSLIMKTIGHHYWSHLVIQELLLLLAGERQSRMASRHPELDDILYHMHKNIGQDIPIDKWVQQSRVSRTVFFARFRERTGMSPSRYMQELKLASAKTTLETTSMSVKEIAASLRFYDEFHFSKLFKQRYGVAPRTYRKRIDS